MANDEPPMLSADTTVDGPMPPPGEPLFPDQHIGATRLIRRIGKGGMGEVWLARHELLGRDVAIKFLPTSVMNRDDPAFRTFIQGAKVAASLEHPGLNKVFNADIADGIPYLVLEFLDGPNLQMLVDRSGRLDLSSARAAIEAVCEAVAELHQRELLHRDIKPSNIVLTRQGRIVVTDFGLACAGSVSALRGAGGGASGTPAYMAPEMFDGVVSARTDVYAIGMTAYQLLTGKLPFSGSSDSLRHQHEEVPVDTQPLLTAGVPEGVCDVIVRAVSKEILFRPKTARHLLVAFRTAFDAARIKPPSRDSLVQLVNGKPAESPAHPKHDADSHGTIPQTIAEFAARKRGLRGTLYRLEPIDDDPLRHARQIETKRRRARLLRIWTARIAAGAMGAGLAVACEALLLVVCAPLVHWQLTDGVFQNAALVPHHPTTLAITWLISVLNWLPRAVVIVAAVFFSTRLYRWFRGPNLPDPKANTRCGWCAHELKGLTKPICTECGHRIGDRGPDADCQIPPARQRLRRAVRWIILTGIIYAVSQMYMAVLLVVALMMLLKGQLHNSGGSPAVSPTFYLVQGIGFFLGAIPALMLLERFLRFDLHHSGLAWCRECRSELRDLANPSCPGCGTGI